MSDYFTSVEQILLLSQSRATFLSILSSIFLLGSAVGYSAGHSPVVPPVHLEPIEGKMDTVEFHIGSPLFLCLKINNGKACEPFNGRPFFFDASGAQVGWGFTEVADSLFFPRSKGSCERYLMLSSENSNLLAEGYYTLSVSLLLDEKSELRSNTIVLHAVHAAGANSLSYSRFLLEQILSNSPLLQDAQTMKELFAPHLPHSPASEVYHAAILYLGGEYSKASEVLKAAGEMAKTSGEKMTPAAAAVSRELERRLSALSK